MRVDLLLAAILTAVGELEVILGPASGATAAVSAIALPATTLPLAWRRRAPLPALAAIVAALLVQALLGGDLVGQVVAPVVALFVVLYAAGRWLDGARALAAAGALAVVAVATRAAFDPSVERAADTVLTLLAVAVTLLVGRWVRGQALLRRELDAKARRLRRDRERDARQAAEEERARIAADLQTVVAADLRAILGRTGELARALDAGDAPAARELLASIAATARDALADVRRVLGVLRREGAAPRLAPPDPDAAGPAAPVAPARRAPVAPAPAPVRRTPAPSPAVLDRVLVAAILAGAAIELLMGLPASDRALGLATAVPIALPLRWRRTAPLAVMLLVFAAVALQSGLLDLDSIPFFDVAAIVCAAYAVGAHAGGFAAAAGLVLGLAATGAHAAAFYPDGVVPALLGGVLAPWTVGRVVRGNRGLTRELRDTAAQVARRRVRDAAAAVTSERTRVARELHDAVAHNVSVIAIQAAGAEGIADRDLERTRQCSALIESVAREALGELGRLTGLPAAATPAPPTLARVDALAERARDAGVRVDLRVEGRPAPLPSGVDLAAFRIVQEALANVAKHAAAAQTSVAVRYEPRAVELEIADDGGGTGLVTPRPDGGGHGLLGMRERVALYGGTLVAGQRADGGFLVRARLPVEGT